MAGTSSLHTSTQATNSTQTPTPSQSSPADFSHLDSMMVAARAKYAADPALTFKIRADAIAKLPTSLPPTPTTLNFKECQDRAIAKSSNLIAEAQAQLAAPLSDFLPTELTAEEIAEQKEAETWMQGYKLANERSDRLLGNSQKLFEDVMDTIDQMQADGIPIPEDYLLPLPPPTPQAESPPMPGAWFADREAEDIMRASLYDGLAIEGCTCSNSLASRMTRQRQPLPFETTGDFGGNRRPQLIAKRAAMRKKTTNVKQVVFDYEVSFVWQSSISGGSTQMNMASSKDDNEDKPCTALTLPPTDTFLVVIFMQDARSRARAGMRGLPANPSPTMLREFVEAHDNREQRIDRCAELACGLLSEAQACLQRPRTAAAQRPAVQRGSSLLERGLEAERAQHLSRGRCEEWTDELRSLHARGGLSPEPTAQMLGLRRTSGPGSEGADHAKPGLDDEPSSKSHVRTRRVSTVDGMSSTGDMKGGWQNIAGVDVKW
ncbi:hypothetical protein LTR12_013093 [Friedmanniomyces endolithicus]|nr:hypothetical protein LTR12_013093 [Friedmanniomyces endolithicus]